MASSDTSLILRVPCRVVSNPTNLALAFPFGGTELGLVKEVEARPNQVAIPLTEESYGQEVIDLLDVGEGWIVDVVFRSLDADAVNAIFPATFTGATSGKLGIKYPGPTYRAGSLRSSSAIKLLVVPLDTGRHPCVYLPNALPIAADDLGERLMLNDEVTLHAIFYAARDSSSQCVIQTRLEDLTL